MKIFRYPLLGLLLGASVWAQAPAGYHLLKTILIEGDGSQDYLFLDQESRRLYVSHGTEVVVVDVESEKVVGTIGGMQGVHGITVAPKLGKGYITSGGTATVKVFDLKTLASKADIPTGVGPDGVLYEPVTQRVFSFNHKGKSLTVIDAVKDEAIKTIELGGQPEFPVTDAGVVWDIVEDISTLVRIDAKTLEITARWPLAPGEGPSGLAMDHKNRRLFVGNNNKVMVVADADNGKIVSDLPIGVHVDATAYDPKTKLIFNANRGSVTIDRQEGADNYVEVGTLEVWPHANTLALDEKTGKIYLAASKYQEPAAGADPKAKATKLPGTFSVQIYGQ